MPTKIGGQVEVVMYNGEIYRGIVTAVVNSTSGARVTVKVGEDRVVTVDEKQVSLVAGKQPDRPWPTSS